MTKKKIFLEEAAAWKFAVAVVSRSYMEYPIASKLPNGALTYETPRCSPAFWLSPVEVTNACMDSHLPKV
jgi:hypothetical protein